MKAEAEILDGFDNIIAKVYSGVTGKTVEESLSDMKDEFWLIGGESVVEAGFASGIIEDDESQPADTENITEKSEIVALMKEAKNKIREIENSEDLNKWAARIHDTLNNTDIEDDGQKLLFSKSAPSGAENNLRGDKMNLVDLLKANPEAKAEHDILISTAKTDGIDNAVKEERKRTAELLALSGMKIPENILKSVNSGDSVGDFAQAELKARNEAQNTVVENKEDDLGKLENGKQTPENVKEEKTSKRENVFDDVIDNMVGKKKEGK
jgi:hypothetical protein